MKRISIALLLLITALVSQASARARKTVAKSSILSASDIHFDPFFDPSLMPKLIASDYKQWPAIFRSSAITTPNTYKSDVNYPLFISALAAMKKQNAKPAFVIITGDFLCHDFQDNFAKYAAAYPDSLRSFTAKTIQFVAMQFDQYFPKTIILPVLGNNDSYCGDYMIEPDGAFLNMFAKAWAPLQRNHSAAKDKAFIAGFSKGGYYTFPLRDGSGGTMVMLNTIFFSAKYASCGVVTGNPSATELDWLADVLKNTKAKHGKAWLASHIPPGIDAYSSSKVKAGAPVLPCPQRIVTMWKDTSNRVFLNLLTQYAPQIKASFAGHTHMDDFRLLYGTTGVPVWFMHITPAVSPLFGNNPAFQEISYSKNTSGLLDMQTYYLDLGSTNPGWGFEYNYQKAYGITALNPLNLGRLRNKIATDTVYRKLYMGYYDVSNPMLDGINNTNWKAYWCTTGSLNMGSFADCYCGVAGK